MVRKLSLFFAVCLGLFFVCALYGEMSIREEQDSGMMPNKYDRFPLSGGVHQNTSTQFIGYGINWSGVGREVNDGALVNSSRWATLLSSSFYVSAWHWRPTVGKQVVFYTTTDPDDTYSGVYIGNRWQLVVSANNDLALGRLVNSAGASPAPVPSTVHAYPIWLKANPSFDYLGQKYVTFGVAGPSTLDPAGQKLGINRSRLDPPNPSPGFTIDLTRRTYLFDFTPLTPSLTPEAMPRTHDSGGPTFVRPIEQNPSQGAIGWGPSVFGIHWGGESGTAYTGTTGTKVPDGELGDDSIVGMYKAEIVAKMKSEQSGVSIVLRENPIFWTQIRGDFNGTFSALPDADDVDIILREVHQRALGLNRAYNWALDLNQNGSVEWNDAVYLIKTLYGTHFGDIQLDGDVDETDQDILLNNFNQPISESYSGWLQGDLNGDGMVDLGDWNLFQQGYQEYQNQ